MQGSVDVRFEAANPSQPISRPFAVTSSPNSYTGPPLRFSQGDGVGKLTVTWTQSFGSPSCQESQSFLVTPVHGDNPTIGLSILRDALSGDSLHFRISECPLDVATAVVGPITIKARQVKPRGGRRTRQVTYLDQCNGGWNPKQGFGRGWGLNGVGGPPFRAEAFLYPLGKRNRSLKFAFSVSVRGDIVSSGRVRSRVHYRRGRIYWEGTDAFVNICINKPLPIKSRGGRLYCKRPARVIRKVFALHIIG